MTTQQFLNEIDSIVGEKPDTVSLQDSLADTVGWDSMAYISFIAMADEKLDATVDAKALAACKTVADLAALFGGKLT